MDTDEQKELETERCESTPRKRVGLEGDHHSNASILFKKRRSPRMRGNMTYNFGGSTPMSKIDVLSVQYQESVFDRDDVAA